MTRSFFYHQTARIVVFCRPCQHQNVLLGFGQQRTERRHRACVGGEGYRDQKRNGRS